MDKKSVIILCLIAIIIIGILFVVSTKILEGSNNVKYCETYYSVNNKCLLSPRVYTEILPPKSFLILNLEPLKRDIQTYIQSNDLNISVYVLNLKDGASFEINANKSFSAASLNKLPVAIIIMKKVENGELSLDTSLQILPQDRSEGSGNLYNTQKNELSVKELLRYMLQDSDNTAFWVLARQVSLEDGNQLTDYLGYYTNSLNFSEPAESLYVSPKTIGNLFISLYLSTMLNPSDSEMILSFLTNTSFDVKEYAKIPEDVVIAQKYGSFYYKTTSLFHDCGIIYIEETRFFYCIMTEGIERNKAQESVGAILNKLYNYILEKRQLKEITI